MKSFLYNKANINMNGNPYTPFGIIASLINAPNQSVFKKLKYFLIIIFIYATLVGIISQKHNLIEGSRQLGQFHLLFSFCLTIIIGFRINVAYSRWWEARGLWGSLVNNIRNLAIKLHTYVGLENNDKLTGYIANFPMLLKYHLYRDQNNCIQVMNNLGITDTDRHLPNALIQKIMWQVNQYRVTNEISMEQFLSINDHITALTDVLGGSEKILNTLPPPGFSIFTKFGLLFYMIIFPFGWISTFEFFVIPILIVIIYILLGLEIIAEEMEIPFGNAYNSLPLNNYAETIRSNVYEISKSSRDDNTTA